MIRPQDVKPCTLWASVDTKLGFDTLIDGGLTIHVGHTNCFGLGNAQNLFLF